MDLLVQSLEEALSYQPDRPTYAIRIFSKIRTSRPPLQDSPLYTAINEYVFDDVQPPRTWLSWDKVISWLGLETGYIMMNETIAEELLLDFDREGRDCETLLVHCYAGVNRSPAVAVALNRIFDLGHDNDTLIKTYPESNWYIHNLLLETAERLSLG